MSSDRTDHTGSAPAAPRPRPPARVPEPGTSPTFCIVAGVITVAVGMLVGLGGSGFVAAGAIMSTVGAVVAGVGVVAAGVRLGMQWADYDRAGRGR
jgi:hypothetical protein